MKTAAGLFCLVCCYAQTRDLRTPHGLLIGRWQSEDDQFASIECKYFGAVGADGTGPMTAYRMETLGKWRRFENRYKITFENPKTGTIEIVFVGQESPMTEALTIKPNGSFMHSTLFVGRDHHKLDGSNDIYVDEKNLSCSEANAIWTARNLGAKSSAAIAARQKLLQSGEQLMKRADELRKRRTGSQ